MARLIDDIRSHKRLEMPGPSFVSPEFHRGWKRVADGALGQIRRDRFPVLRIDNVSDYFYTGTDQDYWDLRKDFPNLAPPYPLFWMEQRLPTHMLAEGKVGPGFMPNTRVGILFVARLRSEFGEKAAQLPPRAHWSLVGELFMDYGLPDRVIGPFAVNEFLIDAEGRYIKHSMACFVEESERSKAAQGNIVSMFHPALLAISFLHCKNVKIADETVPPKLARKYRQRHGVNPTPYKTLIIEPLKQILRREGKSEEKGIAHAMHICRGHFKDYREGAGLFGKYNQLVWHPSMVRGTKHKEGEDPAPRDIEIKL